MKPYWLFALAVGLALLVLGHAGVMTYCLVAAHPAYDALDIVWTATAALMAVLLYYSLVGVVVVLAGAIYYRLRDYAPQAETTVQEQPRP